MASLLSQNEVDILMQAISSGSVPAAEAPVAATPRQNKGRQKMVRLYDFKHPVVFLKDQLRTLQMIHETFARGLGSSMSSALRTMVSVTCNGVDQISYGEYVLSLPDPCIIAKLRIQPTEGRMLMGLSPAVGLGMVDRITGGTGAAEETARPFTEIEQAIVEDMIAATLRDLDQAWNRIMRISFACEGVEHSAQFVQVTTEEDTVVAVTLEVKLGGTQGLLSLCYPFRALNPVVERLNAKHWIAEEQKARAARNPSSIQNSVLQVPLQLSAHLGTAHVTMQEVLQLRPNDVLLLDRGISQPVDLEVGGKPRFTGHLGTSNGKTALRIEARVG